MRIGIDAGGTFTDFLVLDDDGRLESFKIRSSRAHPARVILDGLARIAGGLNADIVHGSTVATNAVLERKGAKVALVTTAGFEDVIQIGRQNRERLYDLMPPQRRPLVSRELCFGLDERTLFDGEVERAPNPLALKLLTARLQASGAESIALCLLHSYRNPANERRVLAALEGLLPVSASHEICPEFREYERTSTTVMNAYVRPLMESYLADLGRECAGSLFIMQSNGGLLPAAHAARNAVRTVLSGPAGGVVGAIEMARVSGFEKILGFDMGGTSTDVSLCEGRPHESTEAYLEGFPIRVPLLDIHTVGAGGGSIARVDEGGLLRVGPESAGADPGPACYGAGDLPTVTDAHVVLGRIATGQFLGGAMQLDAERAAQAMDRVAAPLGIDRVTAAEGILRVANANMQRAIRVVSVERGHDPREFALLAFGGCGGLHACEIASELGIRTVIAPKYAGVLSALGMLMADHVRDHAAGALETADIEVSFRELEDRARLDSPAGRLERFADIRYAGQSYELTVPWNPRDPAAPFHAAHQKMYGYRDQNRAVEVVTVRVRARISVVKPSFQQEARRSSTPELREIRVSGRWQTVRAWQRNAVPARANPGPALVLDYGSTTLVPSGWTFRRDRTGNLILRTE
ncbi:MAG: hydantoinase/oxoprolinase family protein [Bryobacteraceae bacterium]